LKEVRPGLKVKDRRLNIKSKKPRKGGCAIGEKNSYVPRYGERITAKKKGREFRPIRMPLRPMSRNPRIPEGNNQAIFRE